MVLEGKGAGESMTEALANMTANMTAEEWAMLAVFALRRIGVVRWHRAEHKKYSRHLLEVSLRAEDYERVLDQDPDSESDER